MKMEKDTILVVVVAVLVVFAAVQAVQLTLLREKIGSGQFSLGSSALGVNAAAGPSSSAGSSSSAAASLDQLSGQVGGC